jgi:hypothetical protein
MSKATEIVCVLDKSGSMHDLTDDTIGGFNQFIEEQKKVKGKATVTLVLFNHEYFMIYENKKLKKVKPLDQQVYRAEGMTALLEAVGKTIEHTNQRKGKKVFCIITDGYENASDPNDYSKERVKKLVEQSQDDGNNFFFLGANIDSFAEAGNIGIGAMSAVNYTASSEGTMRAYAMASGAVSMSRTSDTVSSSWKDETDGDSDTP